MSQNLYHIILKYDILTSENYIDEVITIRKVVLKMEQEEKYKIIKRLVETNGNKNTAEVKLGVKRRTIDRMCAGYKDQGKAFFVHGNKGRKPVKAFDSNKKDLILDLYKTKYYDANFKFFSELLESEENIFASPSAVRSILMDDFILSPKATRNTKTNLKKHLKKLQNDAKSKKIAEKVQTALVAAEDAHPRRPRASRAGELVQMDASPHVWFSDIITHLHIAVDDNTGRIIGAYFDTQETLKGYYTILNQILTNYGIPYKFLTDRRTVFEYKSKKMTNLEDDTFTQFGYACKELGIELQTSSVAQAKGRVERMFQTLQGRVPILLRLANITTIEAANEFLDHYIKEFNKQFALPLNNTTSVFEEQPSLEKINLTLAILTGRKIDNGSCIRFKNNYYIPTNANGIPVHYHKGTNATVIQAFDGQMFTCIKDKTYALELLPEHELSSRNFDLVETPKKPKKKWIPPMNHPWRYEQVKKYAEQQKHRKDIEDDAA